MPPFKSKKPNEAKRLQTLLKKRENEKKRREKVNSDPELCAKQKEKDHLKYLVKKGKGKIKPVSEMSARELRKKRKQWRINARNAREKKKVLEKKNECLHEKSHPTSPAATDNEDHPQNIGLQEQSQLSSKSNLGLGLRPPSDGRKQAGRKKVRRDRSKVVRALLKSQSEVQKLKRCANKYKKRFDRLQEKLNNTEDLTPRRKVKTMLKGTKFVSREVKRRLLFGEVLTRELDEGYNNLPDEKSKQVFSRVIPGAMLKKYKVLNAARMFLTAKRMRANKLKKLYMRYERKKREGCVLSHSLKDKVVRFFGEDSNSRMCPGKKDTITFKKVKHQKRVLCETLANLHQKFLEEYPECKISYTSFTRLRPFWIVSPKVSERDTCMCRIHANMELLFHSLREQNVIEQKTTNELMESMCCKKSNVECLQRRCAFCKEKTVQYSAYCAEKEVSYMKWNLVKETYLDKQGKECMTKKTKKQKLTTSMGQMVESFEKELPTFMFHVGNTVHQHKEIKELKARLKCNEILIHVDFSENYSCKYSEEIQSVHFVGGQQITLHTGVLYHRENELKPVEAVSFCTLSDSLRHDAPAIWAHLHPILQEHLASHPQVNTMYCLSDSPSTQYRNKTLFYIIGKIVPGAFPNIETIIWNYSESGHGKGAPDGIGAVLKRTADRLVAQGNDIPDYATLQSKLHSEVLGVKLKTVSNEQILEIDKKLERKMIQPFTGTMKVHQVSWSADNPDMLNFRMLSCFECSPTKSCTHYGLGQPFKIAENSRRQDIVTIVGDELNSHNMEMRHHNKKLENVELGDWVVVLYDGKLYPGEIIHITDDGNYEVDAMEPAGKDLFKWPARRDVCTYHLNDIKLKISPPLPCHKQSGTRVNKFLFNDFPSKS